MNEEVEIPYMTETLPVAPANVQFPIHDLMSEIMDDKNISDSFDYVIGHLECAEQRENERPKKKKYCRLLKKLFQRDNSALLTKTLGLLWLKTVRKSVYANVPQFFIE